jgi:hypothetical protein
LDLRPIDPAFLDKRGVLEDLESEPNVTRWFDVLADARAAR